MDVPAATKKQRSSSKLLHFLSFFLVSKHRQLWFCRGTQMMLEKNMFKVSPEARVTIQSYPRGQSLTEVPQIGVTVTPGSSPAAEIARDNRADVATVLVGKKGQPRSLPIFAPGNMQPTRPAPLFIDSASVTPIVQHIARTLENRSPWQWAFRQLSWMPHTEFGNKPGLNAFARGSFKVVDWLIFSAGLVIGVTALPTIYPIFRCISAYKAASGLRDGMADLQLANQLLQTARDLPEVTATTARDILQVYRGQACRARMISVEHRSGWSLLAENELLKFLDSKVAGFSLQVRAQDTESNRKATLLRLSACALVVATPPAPANRAKTAEKGRAIATTTADNGLNWNQWAHTALIASAYV